MSDAVALAHAEHLRTLIALAREHLRRGSEISEELWGLIETTTDKMIAALPAAS